MKITSSLIIAAILAYAGLGSASAAVVAGKAPVVTGITTGTVTLSNRSNIYTATFDAGGTYRFPSVDAGVYALKAEIAGYNQVSTITVDASSASTITVADLAIEKYSAVASTYSYTWVQDQSYAGLPKTEVAQNIVKPVSVTILGKAYQMADISYAQELFDKYGILLNNLSATWTQEYAYRLFAVLGRIPQIAGSDYKYNASLSPTQWTLTTDAIAGDIEIGTGANAGTIRISTAAFTYAAPLVAEINGVRGLYFSKRLHHALVNYVTNNGTNQAAVAKILTERFGLTIDTDAQPLNYALFTSEASSRYQNWFKHPAEIVEVINNFEELPEGMHKIPGFKWLVRRLDGTVNPTYPDAPAIAWTNGRMEFMESAYKSFDISYIARLILHEKAHYIYQFILTTAFKKEWADLGGWQYAANPTNPNYDATGGWQTTKTTEFVSAYAHENNPNEDFAETVAAFVKDPDILKARSVAKYNFIRDAVMLSNSYVSIIRPDLTFTVLNLYPSYDYPGKIKRIATTVTGAAEEDKTLTVEFEITPLAATANPATSIFARIMSPVSVAAPVASYFDMYFNAVNDAHTIFRGTQVLSKHYRSGYWQMPNVTIINSVGLERYESSLLYGFKCYLNNPLEDIVAPQVQPNSSSITVKAGTLAGHPVQIATVKFGVTENTGLLYHYAALGRTGAYSLEQYGSGQTSGSGERTIDFYIRDYAPSGRYTLNQIALKDYGLNLNYTYFKTSSGNSDGTTVNLDENAPSIDIVTPHPDTVAPELDVNRISVTAVPTNLSTPDGETLVTINYFARDNVSGYGSGGNFKLRDPQGIEHSYYSYHRNWYTDFFEGDPTAWEQYTMQVILPRGSVPGVWGLMQMTLVDKAGQAKGYDFTETVRFDPNSTAAADLQITQDPVGKSYLSGESISLTVKTAGGDKVTYEWCKDGVSLITGKLVSSMVESGTSADNTRKPAAATYTSAGTPTLQITGAGQAEAGSYYCIVSNASGRVISKAVDLIYSTLTTTAPTITTQPSSLSLVIGAAGTFNVTANGTPAPTYQWLKDGVIISGATSSTYSLSDVTSANAGDYTVTITNSAGSASSTSARLTVQVPGILLTNQLVMVGHNVGLTAAGATGPVRWQVSTDSGATWQNLADNSSYSGTTSNFLEILKVTAAAHGSQYRYVLTSNNAVSSATTLSVTTGYFAFPTTVGADSASNLYIGDATAHTVQKISTTNQVSLVAGSTGKSGSTNGTGATASFNEIGALAAAADGTLSVADTKNELIRRIANTGVVTTIAGTAGARGTTDATGVDARFAAPAGIARDASGTLFVTDSLSHTLRKISSNGAVTTLAGSAGVAGSADGTGASARFNYPTGVAADPAGNIYVADSGNNTVRKITSTGVVTTIAGTAGTRGSLDGTGSAARFNNPTGLALGSSGELYLADTDNSTIRKITPAGVVTTLAGLPTIAGLMDGTGSYAWFAQPEGLTVNLDGNIYVADTGNAMIRKVTTAGVVTTLALTGTPPAIITQPVNVTVTAGNATSFSVTTSGYGTITYQWRKEGNAITGATSASLSITSTVAADAGSYTVVASSPYGTATSSAATLTVNPAAPAPVPTPVTVPTSSGGGGGAVSPWFIGALSLLLLMWRNRTKTMGSVWDGTA